MFSNHLEARMQEISLPADVRINRSRSWDITTKVSTLACCSRVQSASGNLRSPERGVHDVRGRFVAASLAVGVKTAVD
jgi:hypothetical protein